MAASRSVSIVIWQTLRTSATERMFAKESGLHQTSPKFRIVPISVESCVPPFVMTRREVGLFRMLVSSSFFLKTEQVD